LELFEGGFLGYLNPVYKPSTFLVEYDALYTFMRSSLFQSILKPRYMLDNKVSDNAKQFNVGLKETLKSFF
jgi:hypothetical protein